MLPPLPPRRPRLARRRRAEPPSPGRFSELGRPLSRVATWVLLAAVIAVGVALVVGDPWRARLLGAAIAAFAIVALGRLRAGFPRDRER
ncbi:MAG TPA: hypothetical protein VNJ51_13690 [Candidatus Dormibacteraeota bacterium]|nr:hypothetical protein [Candidatus Dormibacteraeota bacterium]